MLESSFMWPADARRRVTVRAVPEWLTTNEAAQYLRVHRTTIYDLCDRGALPFYEITTGRGRRFKREDLDSLLKPGQSAHERETDRP